MNPRGLNLESVAADQAAAIGFTGGPLEVFELVGRDAMVNLLLNGLLPAHRVLDFGCGSLRIGYWLIDCNLGVFGETFDFVLARRFLPIKARWSCGRSLKASELTRAKVLFCSPRIGLRWASMP